MLFRGETSHTKTHYWEFRGKRIAFALKSLGIPPTSVLDLPGPNKETQYRFDDIDPESVVFLIVRRGRIERILTANKAEWSAWYGHKANHV
jgi:hypothetical protein